MVRTSFAALAALVLAAVAGGQELSPAALKHSKAISPLIEKSTVLIVHLDLAKVDVKAATDYVYDLLELPAAQREMADAESALARKRFDDVIAAGATDVYIALGTDFSPFSPPDVVVAAKKGKAQELADYFKEQGAMPADAAYVVVGDTICMGMSEKARSYEETAGRTSTALARIFDQAGEATAHAVLVLSEDTRTLVRENAPPLPPEASDASATELVDALKYAVLAIDIPPTPKLKLTLQARDAAGAKLLADTLSKALGMASEAPIPNPEIAELKELLPVAALVKMLAPKVEADKVVVSIGENEDDVETIRAAIAAAAKQAREAAEKVRYTNNFKQIGLGLHNYHDTFGKFPAAVSVDKDGKPLLSWRVHILPYLEQSPLYDQFHLNEPWDSEHNKPLIEKMPEIFADARLKELKPGMTNVLAPINATTIWSKKDGAKLADVRDGTSNTILVLQGDAKQGVIWTKPDDLKIDPKKPVAGLFTLDKQFMALYADGSVRMLPASITVETLNALLSADGGEPVEDPAE